MIWQKKKLTHVPKFARLSFVHFGNLWQITIVICQRFPRHFRTKETVLWHCGLMFKAYPVASVIFSPPYYDGKGAHPNIWFSWKNWLSFVEFSWGRRTETLNYHFYGLLRLTLYHSFILHLLLSFLNTVLAFFLGFYRELKLPKACFHTPQFQTIVYTVTCLPAISLFHQICY